MEGTYPLLLEGAQAGEVRVSAEGAWTVFEAQCSMRSGIVRISVYGGGREGYLGVLAPAGEGLALRRRFSRGELRSFPAEIEYAARAGEPVARDAHIAPQDEPPTPEPEEADLYWYATTDGALTAFDGKRNLIALPLGDARIPPDGDGDPRTIGGWDYVVFRKKGSP